MKYRDIMGYSKKQPKKKIVKEELKPTVSDLIKEEFGFDSERKLTEGFSSKKVDTKIIADRMRKDKQWFGPSWAKALLKKYKKGVSARDLDRDMPDYVYGGAISALFDGLE